LRDEIWVRWFLFKEWLKSEGIFYLFLIVVIIAVIVMVFSLFELVLSYYPDLIKVLF